ncbi:hypothetical protein ABZ468_08930 [Streptomyces sp. NPDC005708]|uniref:hypothetical protein n=1 Tax=unclassified Streptomyces TaxID=2593676 RepID=UPI003409F7E5
MPVEDHDLFEDQLASALRQAGDTFEPDRHALVVGGEERGRRIRRGRAAVVGGATGVALVGLGAAMLLPAGHGADGQQRSVAAGPSTHAVSAAPRTTVSGGQLVRTLQKLLPEGRFSQEAGNGTDGRLPPFARLVYDDGKGKAGIAVGLTRVQPGGQEAVQSTQCPDKVFIAYDACTSTTLSDGSRLMVLQGYEYPDRRVDTKLWNAELVTPSGQHISVQEWNSPAEKDAPITRDEPPLSPSQLRTLVTAPEWRAAADTIPVSTGKPSAEPSTTQGVPHGSVSKTLVSLLPKGLEAVSKSRADAEFGYVVLDDGKGASLVQVNVQPDMSDVEGQLFGDGATTLPDGTKVATRQGPGEKGGQGVVMWTVDTIRPGGFRVVISAFNSGAQYTSATRTAPVLTMKQLEAIATSAKWRTLG